MSRRCDICGKGPQTGHAQNKTSKTWLPNLQKVRVDTAEGVKRIRVCTQCIKSNRVSKHTA